MKESEERTHMTRRNRRLLVVMTILIVVAVAAIAFFVYRYFGECSELDCPYCEREGRGSDCLLVNQ